ncbi:mast cell protease 1-like [Rhodnius prolixus]|uniref:mast cell protease 1-like n=1 Tax=Rhodnius prolixus TaxID=13249 RepID=UPI003D18B777
MFVIMFLLFLHVLIMESYGRKSHDYITEDYLYDGYHISVEEVAFIAVVEVINFNSSIPELCTGFFIHDRWVATAAQCFNAANIKRIFVKVGIIDSTINKNRIPIKRLILSGNYKNDVNYSEYDIALLNVKVPPKLRKKMDVIKLGNIDWELIGSLQCLYFGYGETSHKDRKLHAVPSMMSNELDSCGCLKNPNYTYLCGQTIGKEDKCVKDLGGPLICEGQAVGILHKIIECGEKFNEICGKSTYYRYVQLCQHLHWIRTFVPVANDHCDDPLISYAWHPTSILFDFLLYMLVPVINVVI